MAYKVFSNGDALTGGELNTFLMNQSVIAFASEAARNAALTAPLEGQLVWLEDSNKYVYYSGSAWVDLLVPASSGNAIINGAMEIWQRGTSFSLSSGAVVFAADRYTVYADGGSAVFSRQSFTPGVAPVAGYENAFFMREVAGAGARIYMEHKVEDVRTFAGQTVTLSFWAKAAAAFTLTASLNQDFGTGGSAYNAFASTTFSLTTSWVRYSWTVAIPGMSGKTIGTNNNLSLIFSSTATAQTFDLWGVQLEAGSTATAFKRNGLNIADELASCQRYYYRSTASTPSPYGVFTNAFGANSSTQVFTATRLPVTMRTIPTSVDFSTLQLADGTNLYTVTGCVIDPNTSTADYVSCGFTVASGLTQYRPYVARANNSANAFLGFSAEL